MTGKLVPPEVYEILKGYTTADKQAVQITFHDDKEGQIGVSICAVTTLSCPACGGAGHKWNWFPAVRIREWCELCHGSGKVTASDMDNYNYMTWAELQEKNRLVEHDDIPF